ncbi:MAG: hypothetical protein ACRCZ0_09245 [Cetobacterium sp.]
MNNKQPFTLKYLSGVVFKIKVLNNEKMDYYRQLLPYKNLKF